MNTSELGLGQTFAKVFSKVAVGRRKAKISKKVAKFFGGRAKVAGGGVEPRATILYGLENCSVSRLQKVPFPWKIARCTRKEAEAIPNKSRFCLKQLGKRRPHQNRRDFWSRNRVCARDFCETFAKVAVLSCERKKGKLR